MCASCTHVAIALHRCTMYIPSPPPHTHTLTHTHHMHTQFKETLDTVANLDKELRQKVHRLSVGSTPAPPDHDAAANNSSMMCNGYTISNGPSNCKDLSMPTELSVSGPSMPNCSPESNSLSDPLSSNISTNI